MRILLSAGTLLTPLLLNGQPVSVEITLMPEVVVEGEWTIVRVAVTGEGARPIAGATVTLEAGGGLFADTGKSFAGGRTGAEGIFQAEWSCSPCAAAYQLTARARTDDGRRAEGRAGVRVNSTVENPALALAARVDPASVAPGAPATVSVAVFRGAAPAAGVEVKIGVGGGRFLADTANLPNLALGRTDSSGYYRVGWRCSPCARAYDFTVLATPEPGDEPLQARAPLTIGRPAAPREGPLSAVAGRLLACDPCSNYQVTAVRLPEEDLRRSVRADPSCRFALSLPPGLYRVELQQLDPGAGRGGRPRVFEMQVNPRMETTVTFRCDR